MFFLLRMAFWLGLVCVLLPGNGNAPASPDSQIDAVQAVTLASAAVSDVRGFCDRQPEACEVGGKVAVALGHKAEAGARTIYDFVTATIADRQPPQKAVIEKPAVERPRTQRVQHTASVPAAQRGTLTAADLAPAWHGPVPLPPQRMPPHRVARAN